MISVSAVLSAPSGKTYGTAGRRGRVNGLIHELRRRASSTRYPRIGCGRHVDNPVDERCRRPGAALSRPSRTSRSSADRRRRLRPQLRVAVVPGAPDVGEEVGQRLVGRRRRGGPPGRRGRSTANRHVYSLPSADSRARVQSPAERLGDRRDDPELAARRRRSASGRRPRRDSRRPTGSAGQLGVTAAMSSAAGTTSSSRQPFVWPTSMYSMNRSVTPVSRAQRAIGTTDDSLTPRRTTMLILIGVQAGLERRVDPVEHLRDREVDPVHRAEDCVVERVQADRDASQTGVAQRAGQGPQGGPFVVSVRSSRRPSGRAQRRQHPR